MFNEIFKKLWLITLISTIYEQAADLTCINICFLQKQICMLNHIFK